MTILKKLIFVMMLSFLFGCNNGESGNTNPSDEKPTTPLKDKYSAIFGGGPFYSGGMEVIDDLKNSGFTTVILWTIHIGEDGSMNFNDKTIIDAQGNYIGDVEWETRLSALLQSPTSVDRIEIGVGAWGAKSWDNIKTLIAKEGTGEQTKLYKAFQLLMEITGATAINFDDEVTYDVASTVQFSLMLADMGYKISLCPFNEADYWKAVYNQVESAQAGTIDRVYLQCYGGGYANKTYQWNALFGDLKVSKGLWCRNGSNCNNGNSPSDIETNLTKEANNISGGFIWLYDDIQKCAAYGNTASYAKAISKGLQ
ncbi:lysyl endopeptidase [Ancylomarina longa]|uniref:Lysyl endopeptidase n=1 Tax=Ancylomarina longa TaxID=2487017 RepID=A0A434AGH7_9BACT|nr:lysyl endopeptidase [Ancylomarina longa]RUT73472.1 lysyl endopeptidase [Ancylomarina longa]